MGDKGEQKRSVELAEMEDEGIVAQTHPGGGELVDDEVGVEFVDAEGLQKCGVLYGIVATLAIEDIGSVSSELVVVMVEAQEEGSCCSSMVAQLEQFVLERPGTEFFAHIMMTVSGDGVYSLQSPKTV